MQGNTLCNSVSDSVTDRLSTGRKLGASGSVQGTGQAGAGWVGSVEAGKRTALAHPRHPPTFYTVMHSPPIPPFLEILLKLFRTLFLLNTLFFFSRHFRRIKRPPYSPPYGLAFAGWHRMGRFFGSVFLTRSPSIGYTLSQFGNPAERQREQSRTTPSTGREASLDRGLIAIRPVPPGRPRFWHSLKNARRCLCASSCASRRVWSRLCLISSIQRRPSNSGDGAGGGLWWCAGTGAGVGVAVYTKGGG